MAIERMSGFIGGLALLAAMLLVSACGSGVIVKGPYSRGVDHFDAGDYTAAIAEYRVALADSPEDHRIHYNLALCYHDLYREAVENGEDGASWYTAAIESYDRAASLTELKAKPLIARARLMWEKGDEEAAIAFLEAVKPDEISGKAAPVWTLGTMQMSRGRAADAEASFKRAIAIDETFLPAQTALADMYVENGRLDEADALMTKALKRKPHDVTLRVLSARAAERRAREGGGAAGWQECMLRWRLAEALVPQDWEVLEGVANCAEELGDVRLAVRYLWFTRDNASDFALRQRDRNPEAFRAEIKRRLLALYERLPASE